MVQHKYECYINVNILRVKYSYEYTLVWFIDIVYLWLCAFEWELISQCWCAKMYATKCVQADFNVIRNQNKRALIKCAPQQILKH